MSEGVLDGIGELEGVDVPKTILNAQVNNEFGGKSGPGDKCRLWGLDHHRDPSLSWVINLAARGTRNNENSTIVS